MGPRAKAFRCLYFVDRGQERPDWHRAPYHRYLICTNKNLAFWEAGGTEKGAYIWRRDSIRDDGDGWLLLRWRGLDIDYGPSFLPSTLPDGTRTGFVHPHKDEAPWNVLGRAVWWSEAQELLWLRSRGACRPEDEYSRSKIASDLLAIADGVL